MKMNGLLHTKYNMRIRSNNNHNIKVCFPASQSSLNLHFTAHNQFSTKPWTRTLTEDNPQHYDE